MFNVGPGELLAILALALVVLGPDRLPGAVRSAGRVMGELRRISGGIQQELRDALEDHDDHDDHDVPEVDDDHEVDERSDRSGTADPDPSPRPPAPLVGRVTGRPSSRRSPGSSAR